MRPTLINLKLLSLVFGTQVMLRAYLVTLPGSPIRLMLAMSVGAAPLLNKTMC